MLRGNSPLWWAAVSCLLWCACASAQTQWSAPASPYAVPSSTYFGAPPALTGSPAPGTALTDPLQPWLAPSAPAPATAAGSAAPGAAAGAGFATGNWFTPALSAPVTVPSSLPPINVGSGLTGAPAGAWYAPAPQLNQPLAPNPWVQQNTPGWTSSAPAPAAASPWMSTAPASVAPQTGWQSVAPSGAGTQGTLSPGMTWNATPPAVQGGVPALGSPDDLAAGPWSGTLQSSPLAPSPWSGTAPASPLAPNPWLNTAPSGISTGQPAGPTAVWGPQQPGTLWQSPAAAAPMSPMPGGTASPFATPLPAPANTTGGTLAPNPWLPAATAPSAAGADAWWQRNTVPTTPGLYANPANLGTTGQTTTP